MKPKDQTIIIPIVEPEVSQEFFGRLAGFPHTFEFETAEKQAFKAEVYVSDEVEQKDDASIIIVKKERRGVSEIGRTRIKEQSWQSTYDALFVESFRAGGKLEAELQPGKYTLEVSSPNNDALYRLVLGTEKVKRGYFSDVRALFEVKALFGHSKFGALLSPLIYIPLLLIITAGTAFFFYKKRRDVAL
jgi:hypothetical protein